jgi:dihydroneopterin aldolase
MFVSTLLLENMEFRAFHGCYDLEKVVGGRFVVSLAVDVETGEAETTDSLEAGLNYVMLYELVKGQMATPSNLIEHVARRIADAVRGRFPGVSRVEVTVSKIAPPLGGGRIERVSVRMAR